MATPLLISVVGFCLLGAGATAVYAGFYSNSVLEERFADLAIKIRLAQGLSQEEAESESFGRLIFRWAVRKLPAPKPDTPAGEKLIQNLTQAGFIRSGATKTFQVIRVGIALMSAVLGLVICWLAGQPSGRLLMFGVAGGLLGYLLPSYYIGRRARRRQNEIARQLSDVLDLLVVSVEAGLGLFEAIKIVGLETERQGQAIGRELSLVSAEISSGATLGQALRGLSERTAVEDLKPLAATLIQSEQLGAQMAPALRASSDALRARRRLRAEEAAQKVTVKILFPLVLFVLPAMIMVIIGPAIIRVLHTLSP